MKPQSCKARGRILQQWIACTLTAIFEWEDGDAVSRPSGSPGVDIMFSPRARREFPFSIESKNTKIKPGPAALAQSTANHYTGSIPAVCWHPPRRPYEETVVTMRLTDLAQLLKRYRDAK